MKHTNKLYLRTAHKDGTCIVYVCGELDLDSAAEMRAAMSPLVEPAERALILNLHELTYIDSTGIGILVSVRKARHAINAPFSVQASPPNIRKLFDMTGISPFLLGNRI